MYGSADIWETAVLLQTEPVPGSRMNVLSAGNAAKAPGRAELSAHPCGSAPDIAERNAPENRRTGTSEGGKTPGGTMKTGVKREMVLQ